MCCVSQITWHAEFQTLPSYIFNLTHIKSTLRAILTQAVLSFPVIMAVSPSVGLFGFKLQYTFYSNFFLFLAQTFSLFLNLKRFVMFVLRKQPEFKSELWKCKPAESNYMSKILNYNAICSLISQKI